MTGRGAGHEDFRVTCTVSAWIPYNNSNVGSSCHQDCLMGASKYKGLARHVNNIFVDILSDKFHGDCTRSIGFKEFW
jgi:hypothetical protein